VHIGIRIYPAAPNGVSFRSLSGTRAAPLAAPCALPLAAPVTGCWVSPPPLCGASRSRPLKRKALSTSNLIVYGQSTAVNHPGASRSAYRGAQLAIAASWCVVLCNKDTVHLGARGHQEAPVRQWRVAPRGRRRGGVWHSFTQSEHVASTFCSCRRLRGRGNFEALCRLSKLYMVAVIGFLEDRFGPGAIKMPAFSDFVFKLGDAVICRSGSGIKVCAVRCCSGTRWWIAWPSQGSVRGQCGG
jgi:hypothetical protein